MLFARFDWFLNLGISSTIHLLAASGWKKCRARPISSENEVTFWELLLSYILKQLFASVSVTSGGYLPRRSGSVNIHRYSPPLLRIIVNYSPPGGFRRKKMAREPHFVVKYSSYLGTAIKLVLYILKQLFASVSVNSGGYLPRRSGSVNIHRYSPPLRRIIVKY